MTTEMLEREEISVVEEDDENDENHIACLCTPKVSLCGAFLTRPLVGEWEVDDNDLLCPECVEVANDPCPRCGE